MASPTARTSPSGCNDKFQEDVNKAVSIAHQAERTKLYVDAQKIVDDQVPWLNIAHSTVFEPCGQVGLRLHGFATSALTNSRTWILLSKF